MFLLPLFALAIMIFSKNGFNNTAIFVSAILAVIVLIFYSLTITVTEDEVFAHFNFGLFKRTMKFSEMDLSSIKNIRTGLFTGIGIRCTKHGWLYNSKAGDAKY